MSLLASTRRRLENLPLLCRRHYRWLSGIVILLLLVQLFNAPFNSPFNIDSSFASLQFVKSGYDWSQWQPFHPVGSLRPLPTDTPKPLPRIQHAPVHPPKFDVAMQERRRAEIKRVAKKSWDSYKNFAWMHDELAPLTGRAKNPFGGWAATLVDSLDTLWVMGLKEEFEEAVGAAIALDWAVMQGTSCNMFETTIRHLGGLLSAYDLSKHPALLQKAIELGDMLYAGFDTPTHMPPFWFDFEKAKSGRLVADNHQPAASATTLSMEFTRLAQLTGNSKYYDAVARVTDELYASQNWTRLPGMWPTFFNLEMAIFTYDYSFTLGALSDSMYEYLLKMHLLLGATEPRYEQLYRAAADTIEKNLIFRPMTPENLDILFTGTYMAGNNPPLIPEGQHLACFVGGMFAIGGKVFDIPEHVDLGARLTNGCIWAYRSFQSGLAPEIFQLVPCESTAGCEWNEQKWTDAVETDVNRGMNLPKGFQNARDPRYILRPEAIESVFVLYRITGDEHYREAAWEMFQSIQKATETKYGNAAIGDVTVTGKPPQVDSMESFWIAETLKYLYLIFSPSDTISLDDYVLNTECHPFRIPKD